MNGEDSRSVWHPLTWRERVRLFPGVHDLAFVLTYYTGVRDRMRCPSCKAVGTWKMHGSIVERWMGDISVRRCLCKWCGYYTGPRGRIVAFPDSRSGVWALPEDGWRDPTPAEIMAERRVNPWHG